MCGLSAGSLCWFAEGVTVSPARRGGSGGSGFPSCNAVHYDGERRRRPSAPRLRRDAPGYAGEDGAALHFVGAELARVVTSRPGAGLPGGRADGEVVETPLGGALPRGGDGGARARRMSGRSAPDGRGRHRRSWRWAAAASRWGRRTRRWTSTCGARAAREPRICLLRRRAATRRTDLALPHGLLRPALRAHPHLPVPAGGSTGRPRDHLLAQDMIYVGGGSMVNLLAIWRAHGLDKILREAWQAGTVLAGLGAGSMCWFEVASPSPSGRRARARARLPDGLQLRALRRGAGAAPGLPAGGRERGDPARLRRRRRRGAAVPRARVAEQVVSRPRAGATGCGRSRARRSREVIEPRVLKAPAHADPTAPLAVEEMRALHAARRGRRLD